MTTKLRCQFLCDLTNHQYISHVHIYMGHAVAQLVEALLYKPEGPEFDSRCCHWNFLLTKFFPLTQPLTEMSKRNIF
jgi:hypothetical protein